jgi:hypothetical protein
MVAAARRDRFGRRSPSKDLRSAFVSFLVADLMTITAPSGCGTDFVAVLVIGTAALKIFAFHRTRIASVPVASIIGGPE